MSEMAVNGIMKKKRKKRHFELYTVGQLNKIADSIVHPFFDKGNSFIILDGMVHALLEQNIPASARKFVRYNLPKMLKQAGKKRTVRRKLSKK